MIEDLEGIDWEDSREAYLFRERINKIIEKINEVIYFINNSERDKDDRH